MKEVFAEGVGNLVATLQEQMPAADAGERREQALAMLSRAVGDEALSGELREAVRKRLPAGGG